MVVDIQKNYEEVSEKLTENLDKSAEYFYELGKTGNENIEITADTLQHISQLGLALQLIKNLKEEDSKHLTGREGHQVSYDLAEHILKRLSYGLNVAEQGFGNIEWSECEQAYRMIDLAMKYMQSKRTNGKVEAVLN
jgi:hypothetical protein